MSIFRKKIDDINVADIEAFVTEKHPENIRLEYKSGFSATATNLQIAKEVSAFANQQGGIILYGVSEEATKTRKPDIVVGIDKSLTPRQKIQSICIDHIYPPIVPEIQECELKTDKTKVAVVVRVEMSDAVPHTINDRTGFYIRSQDRCEPREMTDEEIKSLLNKREKIVERREWLFRRTYERVFPVDVKRNYMLTPAIFIVTPLYPMQSLIERQNLYDIYTKSAVRGSQGLPLETDRIITASDSICSYISSKDDEKVTVRKERYGEINVFGQISHFENAIHNFNSADGVFLGYELRKLFLLAKFAGNFYKNVGYWGVVRFIVKVESCRGVKLISPRDGYGFSDEMGVMELDKDIDIARDCSVAELIDGSEEFVEDIFQEYLWAIGLSVHRANSMPVGFWVDKIKKELYGKMPCPKCNKYEISKIDNECNKCKENAVAAIKNG